MAAGTAVVVAVVATVGAGDVVVDVGGAVAVVDGVPVVVGGAVVVTGVVELAGDGLSDVAAEVLGAALPAAFGPQPLSARAAMASPAAWLARILTGVLFCLWQAQYDA